MEVLQTCFVVTGKELPQPEPVSNQSINPHKKMEESMCSIDQGNVSKSPLTKQKILDVYADVFKGLRTFPGEPYKFKLKEKNLYWIKSGTAKTK